MPGHSTKKIDPLVSYEVRDCGYETPCWVWTRGCNDKGYGLVKMNKRRWYAHRWFYEHFVGPPPEGFDLDHLCRTTRCVNPAHLEPVTHAENMRRSVNVKLTAAQVIELRQRVAAMDGSIQSRCEAIAPEYGIVFGHARRIVDGQAWANLEAA